MDEKPKDGLPERKGNTCSGWRNVVFEVLSYLTMIFLLASLLLVSTLRNIDTSTFRYVGF